jgi:PTS system ascorbate-specific IIB component
MMLKVVAICGCGMGSSVILRLNAEKAFKALGVEAKVEVSDITTGKGAAKEADLVIIGTELAYLIQGVDKPVIQLKNFVNKNEINEKLVAYCKSQNLI